MTNKEEDISDNMVIRIISINAIPTHMLFDCGATHSFMSRKLVEKLNAKSEKLYNPYYAATPVKMMFVVDLIFWSC